MLDLLNAYERDSWLGRRNPSLKLLALFAPMLGVILAFDMVTPALFAALTLLALVTLGRVPLRTLIRPLLLFGLLGSVGLLLTNAFYYRPDDGSALTILWQMGPLTMSAEGLRMGGSLTLRMLAIVLLSLTFVATTDPTDFVLSLIQNARFPFRLGYGVLVAYRFMPLWRSEMDQIRAAHRIRGVGERATLRGRLEQWRRYAVPLLAGAIRKAERVAIAMDSRAFGAVTPRTAWREQRITRADWLMLAASVAVTVGVLVALSQMGLLVGFGVVPE